MPNDPARPTVAEEQTVSAVLADPQTIYVLDDFGLSWRDLDAPIPRACLHAAAWCLDVKLHEGQPLTVERGNLIRGLQALGYWESVVAPEQFQRLYKQAIPAVARAALEYARVVKDASLARQLANACRETADRALREPQSARGYAALHTEAVDRIVTAGWNAADHSAQAIGGDLFEDIPGVYTGIPFYDVTSGGLCEAELIGIQAKQKDGKTRTALHILLGPMLRGVPGVLLTTDNTAKMLKKRLIVLIALARLIPKRASLEPRDLIMSPKELNPRHLSEVQMEALRRAKQEFDDVTKLQLLDAGDHGIQDFETAHRWLARYVRPPFNARFWMYDHVADLDKSEEHGPFKSYIKRLKTSNVNWGTTGIMLNQRSEQGNRDQAAGVTNGAYGSYGGTVFAASMDTLYQPTTTEQAPIINPITNVAERYADTVTIDLLANRWGGKATITYEINLSSGIAYNSKAVPDKYLYERDQLPYMRMKAKPPTWDRETDGDPYRH